LPPLFGRGLGPRKSSVNGFDFLIGGHVVQPLSPLSWSLLDSSPSDDSAGPPGTGLFSHSVPA